MVARWLSLQHVEEPTSAYVQPTWVVDVTGPVAPPSPSSSLSSPPPSPLTPLAKRTKFFPELRDANCC